MSFAGFGPLGKFGWGTSTLQALDAQTSRVVRHHATTAQTLTGGHSGSSSSEHSGLPPFPSLGGVLLSPERGGGGDGAGRLLDLTAGAEAAVFPAAVFTDNESENHPLQYRLDMHDRKRAFNDLPKDVSDAQLKHQQAALESLQRRHAAMKKLPTAQQTALMRAAVWICSLVVHVFLRELLLYPLVRDQLEGGEHFYQRSLQQNDSLRAELREIRNAIYRDATDTAWQGGVDKVQQTWAGAWEEERREWLPRLGEYLVRAQVSALRDICASHEHQDIPEPSPPTSHDLSYGQQLVQMWEILTANMLKTGNMQGIPRPRQDVDWALPDGFEPAHDLTYGPPPAEKAQPLAPTGLMKKPVPFVSVSDPDPSTSTSLPPPRQLTPAADSPSTYVPFGASLTRLTPLPDAASRDDRMSVDKAITDAAESSKSAHRRAALVHYGSEEAEDLARRKSLIASAADKATSLNEFLADKKHTTDLAGSYLHDEVTLAFRNHGK